MTFTKEIVDLSNLDTDQISSKLKELNIPLTPEEALKIQNEMLGRAPSLPELVLFSIQGSEHCSYKSSRTHLKQFVTDSPDVVLGAKEDAGVIARIERRIKDIEDDFNERVNEGEFDYFTDYCGMDRSDLRLKQDFDRYEVFRMYQDNQYDLYLDEVETLIEELDSYERSRAVAYRKIRDLKDLLK